MSDFAKLHASVFEAAKANLKRSGNLAPVGILCREDTKAINTIAFQWQSNEEKARNMAAFGATVYLTKSDYAFAVLDACMGTMEEHERGIKPIEKPMDDRREIVVVIGFEMGAVITHTARAVEYRRSGSDQKTIGFKDSIKTDDLHAFDGDMVRWFNDGYKMAKWNSEHPEADILVCEHGRRKGAPCPHCLGQPKAPDGPAA
jgi:hypothetical protein